MDSLQTLRKIAADNGGIIETKTAAQLGFHVLRCQSCAKSTRSNAS